MKRLYIWAFFAALTTVAQAQDASERLTGTPIGSECVNYGSGPQIPEYAFDNDPNTYYASQDRSNTWVGLDLGKPYVISQLGYMPRSGYESRVTLGVFEGSNSPDFLDAIPLYVIPKAGSNGEMTVVDVPVSVGFRYVRYVGPHDVRCNIAEVAFWGKEGVGDSTSYYQISGIPTLSIHIYDGSDPASNKELERECNMTLTYDNGQRIQEYPMTIRGRGNASWGFNKKPYRIKFNDGKKHHMLKDSPRESPAKAKKWTLLSNEGDKTLMRNLLAHEVSRQLELPYTVYSEPVDLILNGEYRGLYNLCDQVDENKNRIPITEMETYDDEGTELTGGYHIEIDNYASGEPAWFWSSHGTPVTIKSPDGDEITTNQRRYIQDFFNQMESEIWKNGYDDPETGYMKILDISSFLRFFLLGEMSGNTDTYYSTHMWKERGENKFYTSPGWDFDLAFENDSRTYPICNNSNWIYASKGSCTGDMRSMVNRIIQGENASKMLKKIWAETRNKGFNEDYFVAYLDSMENLMTYSANLNFIRWPYLNQKMHMNFQALGSYEAEVNTVRQYILQRFPWMDEKLSYAQGDVVNDTTMYIATPKQLVEFANIVNKGATGSTAHITSDLDFLGVNMPIIGTERKPFHGEFDGGGHTISNLVITGGNNTGLIGSVNGSPYIHDFIVDNTCSITGSNFVGIVGASIENSSERITIERVGNEANVSGERNVAGIYGCNLGSGANVVIHNCYNTGTITGGSENGAISGWVGSSYDIQGCWNIGQVSGVEGARELYRFAGWERTGRNFSTFGSQGTIVSPGTVASGELCWLANGESSESPVWYQRLGEDSHPVFDYTHGIVYKEDGKYTNGKFMLGDANVDGKVDIKDLSLVANYILGRNAEGIDETNADPNADGQIDVLDLVQIGSLMKTRTILPDISASQTVNITSADATIKPGVIKRFSSMINASKPQAVFQTDVFLPDGITMNPASIGRGTALTTAHLLEIEPIQGGYRLIAYAPDLASFTSGTATAFVLKLEADASFQEGVVRFTKQLIATAGNEISRPEDASCTLTMAPTPVTRIIANQSSYELTLGQNINATIVVTVLPETATDKRVSYTSSAPNVASVDEQGILTANAEGEAVITIKAMDGSNVKASVTVMVLPDPTGIEDIVGENDNEQIYDLRGIRVEKMQRGRVYIINGKRVIIK